jgi:hypothetical protein
MKHFKTVSAGRGRTRVRAELYRVGPDVLAVLGGEGAHVGAASLAEAVPGEGDHVTTIRARGHREAELTEYFSQALCSATGRRVVTIAGIHLDHISKAEIETIRANVVQLVRLLDLDESAGAGPTAREGVESGSRARATAPARRP